MCLRTQQKDGPVPGRNSVGGTPTGAVGTTALPGKSGRIAGLSKCICITAIHMEHCSREAGDFMGVAGEVETGPRGSVAGCFPAASGDGGFPRVARPDPCGCFDPDHECAVTLFTHGQVHGADAAVPVLRPEPAAVFIQSWREAGFVSTDVPLRPGRGPPSLRFLPS